jgi:hypothetical protein
MTGKMQFAKAEERMHSKYDVDKHRPSLTIGFDGVQIGRDPDGALRISHQAYI